MKFFSKLWQKLKTPSTLGLVVFYIYFVCVLTATFVLLAVNHNQNIANYVLYALSALGLAYCVYTIVYLAPTAKQNTIKVLRKFKLTSTMLDSYGYRTIVFSIFSFVINIAFVAFHVVIAIMAKSYWYMSIAIYYFLLSVVKGLVLLSKKKYQNNTEAQIKTYRDSGVLVMLLTFAFSGVITLIYTTNMYFEYAGLAIYAFAAFTFYKLILAIVNIFKSRRFSDLYLHAIRDINLASALISIIVLQVAMFQAFSPVNNTSRFNAITGGVISLMVIVLGIFMIIKANRLLKIINQEKIVNEEQNKL